jgi:lipoprotein-anchoring transpeptidase ErfK/SrfK
MQPALLLLPLIGLFAGCVSAQAPKPASVTSASEPFPIRPVDRSRFDERFRPTRIANTTGEAPGTIVVDTRERQLYYIVSEHEAVRYGVAVGAAGKSWKGVAHVGRKAQWPAWYPTDEMRKDAPGIPRRIPPGADNPLSARALYLHQNGKDTLYRIHGTAEPWTIGTEVSSGCIRLLNEDIIDLFDLVKIGAKVVVL